MEYFDKLHHNKDSRLRKVLDYVMFERFKPWNTKAAIALWKDYMKEIYRHVDSDYTGLLMVDLLRFHRNLYQHYYIHVKCRKRGGVRVTIEENLKFTAKVVCNTIAVTVATYYSTIHWRQHKMKQTTSGDHPFNPHTELLKTGGVLVLVGFPSEVKISCQPQYLPVLLSLHLCSETLWLMQETMTTCSLSQRQTLLLMALILSLLVDTHRSIHKWSNHFRHFY
ncbi:unnamed protein product [Prunus brigantina]